MHVVMMTLAVKRTPVKATVQSSMAVTVVLEVAPAGLATVMVVIVAATVKVVTAWVKATMVSG